MGRRRLLSIAAALAAGVALCGLADRVALARHAGSGPATFTGSTCAGTPDGGTAGGTGGLAAWDSFGGSASHAPLLAAAPPASWSFAAGGSIVSAPAVVDGIAYFGSMGGCVYALALDSGHLLWSFAADNQVMGQPLVAGGRVFFGTGDKIMATSPGGPVRGTGQSAIYALQAGSGRLLWRFATAGEDMPTPLYTDGVVYAADGARNFYALDAATGALLWKTSTGSVVSMSSPALAGDIAVVGGGAPYALVGVDLRTHRVAWTLPLPAAQAGVDDGSPAIWDGLAFIQVPEGGRFARRIVELAVDADDGRIAWQRVLGTDRRNELQRLLWQGDMAAYGGEEVGSAAVAGDVVYVGSPALGRLWALDAASGAPVWARPAHLPAAVRTVPALSGGHIYVAGNSRLFILDAASGALEGSLPLGTWGLRPPLLQPCTTPSPLVVGSTLLVGAGADADTLRAIPLGTLPA